MCGCVLLYLCALDSDRIEETLVLQICVVVVCFVFYFFSIVFVNFFTDKNIDTKVPKF